jgi:hypothetical protein
MIYCFDYFLKDSLKSTVCRVDSLLFIDSNLFRLVLRRRLSVLFSLFSPHFGVGQATVDGDPIGDSDPSCVATVTISGTTSTEKCWHYSNGAPANTKWPLNDLLLVSAYCCG